MERLVQLVKIILGNLVMAVAVNGFILPFSFASGGSTGLALVLSHYLHFSFDLSVSAIAVVSFLLGLFLLGKKFALTTLISTIVYPIFIKVTSFLANMELVNDPLFACFLAGALMGAGLGLVIQSGASTGGLDIPPLVMQKYLHIPVTYGIWGIDITLLILEAGFFMPKAIVLGIILECVTVFVMNRMLLLGKSAVQVTIMSKEYEKIGEYLMNDLDKGVTFFEMTSGYLKKEQKAVISVFEQKELFSVRKAIQKIDPKAFMIVCNVQEVRGYRFEGWNKNSIKDISMMQ